MSNEFHGPEMNDLPNDFEIDHIDEYQSSLSCSKFAKNDDADGLRASANSF